MTKPLTFIGHRHRYTAVSFEVQDTEISDCVTVTLGGSVHIQTKAENLESSVYHEVLEIPKR